MYGRRHGSDSNRGVGLGPGQHDAVERFLDPSYVRHGSATQPPIDRNGTDGFPNIELTLEEASADRDLVWFRSTMRGTHHGEFPGDRTYRPGGHGVALGPVARD